MRFDQFLFISVSTMPRNRIATSDKITAAVSEYGSKIFSGENNTLFCKLCTRNVNFSKKAYIMQHVNTAGHRKLSRAIEEDHQSDQPSPVNRTQDQYFKDVCKAFVEGGIPLWKLNNLGIDSFLFKYTKRMTPDESTIRKCYADRCYAETLVTNHETYYFC